MIGDGELLAEAAGAITGARVPAVVALADGDRPARALRDLHLHGWGLVACEASAAELRAAVTAAAQGFTVLPATLATRLLAAEPAGPPDGLDEPSEPLTPREREVLALLG